MGETRLSIERAAELTGWTPRHARRVAKATNELGRREVLLSSLPEDAQIRYAEQLSASSASLAIATKNSPVEAATRCEKPKGRERGIVPEHLRATVDERHAAIRPLILFAKGAPAENRRGLEYEGTVVHSLGELVPLAAAKAGVSATTLGRWYSRYKTRGEAGLAPNIRADRGQSRFFEDHPKAAVYARAKYLGENQLSIQQTYEALREEWETQKLGPRGEMPSYNTVRRYLRAIPKVTEVLAREGKRIAIAKCTPYVIRGRCSAMEWWVADHRVHDVFVYNTLFPEQLERGKAYRLWMTAIFDMGTQKMVGCVWAPTPSSRTISSAIRMGVGAFGFPKNFYWDNGKDFQAVESRLASPELARFLESSGIEITSALPFSPRSKPIEAFFTRFSKRFDTLWGAGYCGNKPQLCSDACREAQKQHERFAAGKSETTEFYSDVDFIRAGLRFIDEYNEAPQKRLDFKSPNQIFDQQWPATARGDVDRRRLDQLFWQRDERTLQQGGCVELNGLRYEPGDESFGALSLGQGKRVTIARDPYDLAGAVAFELESGEFLGELRIQERVAQSPHGRLSVDGIKAQKRRGAALLKYSRSYMTALEMIAQTNGWKPARERLLERALGTGTNGVSMIPAAAAPGAERAAERPEPRRLPASPFVSDAVESLLDLPEDE